MLPGVAQVAMQQATHAARNVIRAVSGKPPAPFKYWNLGDMATIGRHSAVGDFGWMTMKGYVAWFAWLFIHIFKLIGFRNRLSVMTQWAFSYLTYQRSVRLITNDDAPAGRAS
jgi:NADH dehydrogenase